MGKCKNKKCGTKCGTTEDNNLWRNDFEILGINYSGLMRICKVSLSLLVFVISSIKLAYTGDVLWQCVWSLSLLKVVELSDE